ncbi:ATP-dependent DNA helicase [Nesterenkonia muleiensis]|uniref:ATP-dependent DNA helicase n=1 Tax=Nesterenkonia muleiensis TaxID=2282648 RepID=UPI000E763845|nr:ATP-dependent DNA helicase [Nesterenkonia muleiensis]
MTTTPSPECPTLVYGAPGAGKTAAAVEAALDFLRTGEDSRRLLVLSPSRTSAARLRDAITTGFFAQNQHAALSEQPSRAFASYAFWVLSEARRKGFISFAARTPRLLSGAEQDRIIWEIISELHGERAEASWPASVREAMGTEGFRKEIRELFDRAREYDISASGLEQLAEEHGSEEWHTAAIIYSRYMERFHSAEFEDAYDPSGLISQAVRLLQEHPELLDAERRRLMLVIVDDLQEASPSVHRLLRLIAAGKPVLAFANPDVVTQGFRGARPDLLKSWVTRMAADPDHGLHASGHGNGTPEVRVLSGSRRMDPAIASVYAKALTRIPAPAESELRSMWQGTDTAEDGSAAEAITAPSDQAAERAVLAEVLNRYDRHQVPFNQIAVIARSGASAQRIGRVFAANGVPVRQSLSDVVLNQEPAVMPLLQIIELNAGGNELTVEDVLTLLGSRYGHADAMELRRIRQLLRQQEIQHAKAEGRRPRSSDALILAAAQDIEHPVLKEIRSAQIRPLERIARMLAAARAASGDNARPGELLWAIWEASGAATDWQQRARGAGREAETAHHDLDAVLALFQAADRFEDHNPGAGAGSFGEHMQRLELPMDTLAETVAPADAVEILTPTSAAGRAFDTVILLDLQHGVWPNLRPRGELLRSRELVDVVEGLTGPENQNPLIKRLQTLQDEYRLFAAAVSRGRHRLFAVAVDSDQNRPSSLLDLVTPADRRRITEEQAAARPLTEAHLVAELRRDLEQNPQDIHAAEALAALAEAGVPGADPARWWGLEDISDADPLYEPGEDIYVRPSSIGVAVDQPLQWFVEVTGGTMPTDFSRMLGTLVHKIAEDHPTETDPRKLIDILREKWDTIEAREGWQNQIDWNKAVSMLEQVADYHRESRENRDLIATELKLRTVFELNPEREPARQPVVLGGLVDRVEKTSEGKLMLVDLKTGSRAPSAQQAQRHPQLGAYQLLAQRGDRTELDKTVEAELTDAQIASAALLFVATHAKPTLRSQDPVDAADPQAWPYRQIAQAVRTMQSTSFEVRHAGAWGTCWVGPLCPLCSGSTGKEITQP